MAVITLNSVGFPGGVAPAAPLTGVIVRYRKTSDPDVIGNYTEVTNSAVILTNGNFQAAVVISGLDPSTTYTVWVKTQCGNGVKKNFATPAPACVDCDDITGEVTG